MKTFNQLFKLPTGNQDFLKLIYLKSKPNYISSRSKKQNYTPENWVIYSIFNFEDRSLNEFKEKLKEKTDLINYPDIDLIKLEKLIKKELIIDHIPELQKIISQEGINFDSFFNYLKNPPEPLIIRENSKNQIRIRTRKRDSFLVDQFFKRNKEKWSIRP